MTTGGWARPLPSRPDPTFAARACTGDRGISVNSDSTTVHMGVSLDLVAFLRSRQTDLRSHHGERCGHVGHGGDMARRVLWVTIDSQEAEPWKRAERKGRWALMRSETSQPSPIGLIRGQLRR